MSSMSLFSPETVERLGWMLVHFLWQATAVALLLAVLLRLLWRASANARYLVSCLALLLMVVLPAVAITLIDVAGPAAEPGPLPTIAPEPVAPVQVPQALPELSEFAEAPTPVNALDRTAAIPWPQRLASALEPALPYGVFAWLTGVFGLCAWHVGGWAQLQRFKRRMVREVDQTIRGRLASLSERLGVHRAVAVLESALVEVPTVVGWLRPVVLLPASALTGLSAEQLDAILAHELAHIRRYDYLVNLLQTVVEILGFYHPAVWWVSQRMRIERENCCDDLAVRACGDSVRYARALTCMEEIRHRQAELALAATGGNLVNRITRLLGRPAVDDRRCAWLPGLIALLLVTALLIPTTFVLGATGPQQTGKSSDSVAADADDASNLPANEQGGHAAVPVRADVGSGEITSTDEKISVSVEFTVAKVLHDEPMDHETTGAALNILGETAPAAGAGQALMMTAREVLRRYVATRELPPARVQSLTDLLRSRGYIKIEASPQVLTHDGVEAKIQIGEQRPVPVPATGADSAGATTFEYIQCGTAIQVTPHVQDANVVTLEMAVELTDILPNPSRERTPLIRRRTSKSTLTMSTDRCFSLFIEQWNGKAGEPQNEEPVLITVGPSIVASVPATRIGVNREPVSRTVPAEAGRQQVRLDVRVFAVEPDGLRNLDLTWSQPLPRAVRISETGRGDQKDIAKGPPPYVRIGYTAGPRFTDTVLAALDLLHNGGQADIVSNLPILAQENRESRLKIVTEEWFMRPASTSPPPRSELCRVETGTILMLTPHVGDHNDITLDMSMEISDRLPRGPGDYELPVVTRHTARNAVTIPDGGTVVMVGWMENRAGRQDKPAREIAVFVTAHLADNNPDTSLRKQ